MNQHNTWLAIRPQSCVLCVYFIVLAVLPLSAKAASDITLRYNHHLFSLNPSSFPEWYGEQEVWFMHDKEIKPKAEWRVDGDNVPVLPPSITKKTRKAWNKGAIVNTVSQRISSKFNREPGSVVITKTSTGVTFDGIGMLGRKVNEKATADLLIEAMEQNITDVQLPIDEIQPNIVVNSEELRDKGIHEVVAVGESDFTGSTWARIHNVTTGLSKFNGHIIPKGSIFSFNEVLGPVDASTGYKRELVILGDRTLPEYGGGLCQVSTTAYRGIWEYGYPIEQRRNHSFAVSYYGPQGTDATIYPPHTDMKFTNDGPSDLLIQTYIDVPNVKAYFIYYGTRDNRKTDIIGPYIWGQQSAPPPKTEYTTDLAPGERKKLGSAVPGLRSAWFRVVKPENEQKEEIVEGYYSVYQARPLFYQVGVGSIEEQTTDQPPAPSWFGEGVTTFIQNEKPEYVPEESPVLRINPRSLR